MMLSYERQSSSFKIILTGDTIVNITEESLYHYFSPYISRDLFEFAANFSLYEIPGHVLVILVIICLYSRDGMLMKKQVRQQLGQVCSACFLWKPLFPKKFRAQIKV